ncbi:MAG: M48 family metallopeptidase [Deltaproteobacteria bacterium]|nr:M48 family metallopeptidase [Deltaproteobacteria bacterium]
MDFFAAQDKSRAQAGWLVFLFIIAVFAVVAGVYAVVIGVMFKTSSTPDFNWFDPKLFLIIGGGTCAIILVGSIVKIIALSKGGSYVAESLGGRLIPPGTTDLVERKVLNVVEEMAIAAGMPVPQVYILDSEKGINAFAAGYSPSDAIVAVTRGCAEQLGRDELQGVVAHEFSHILNGDMRLNIRLMGLLSGIMLIATIGWIILRSGSGRMRVRTKSSSKGGGQIYLLALLLLVVGYIGVLMGRLIQSAVSRQREFLADASAVQFTRNPSGISNALKKIGGFPDGSKIVSPAAGEACHMFFSTAIGSLFATHPPLAERIKRIDPAFSGEFEAAGSGDTPAAAAASAWEALDASVSRMSAGAPAVVKKVGTITAEQVSHGAALLAAVPEKIKAETGDILGASALVCALLLSGNEAEKKRQTALLAKSAPRQFLRHVALLDKTLADLNQRLRLPVLDLALPALRMMSVKQYENLKGYIKILVEADAKISIFEFSVQEVIFSRVEAALTAKTPKIRFKSMTPLTEDCVKLISALAAAGQSNPADAAKAFSAAFAVLPLKKAGIAMLPAESVAFKQLHTSLTRFAASSPGVKKAIFEACAHCVLYDGTVSMHEAELLRAIAYFLNIPLPPFLYEK